MAKKITTTFAALLALTVWGCNGPVEKAIDCAKICDEAGDCVGGNDFDEKACRQDCREDAKQSDADQCEQCLQDQKSCAADAKCTLECTGVGIAVVFN